MTWKWFTKGLIFVALLLIVCPSWAAHPLITDDTGTQGKGKFQLEMKLPAASSGVSCWIIISSSSQATGNLTHRD
jgi:hypothetical protein